MRSARRQFAKMTAMLEDLRMLAIEGQSRDATPDMQHMLIASLRDGLGRLASILAAAEGRIDRRAS